jgi:hypothetical protein
MPLGHGWHRQRFGTDSVGYPWGSMYARLWSWTAQELDSFSELSTVYYSMAYWRLAMVPVLYSVHTTRNYNIGHYHIPLCNTL